MEESLVLVASDDHETLEHLMFKANAAFMALELSESMLSVDSMNAVIDAEFAFFDLCAFLQCMGLESESALWQTAPLLETCLSKLQVLRRKRRDLEQGSTETEKQSIDATGEVGEHRTLGCLLRRMQQDPVLGHLLSCQANPHPPDRQEGKGYQGDVLAPSTAFVLNAGAGKSEAAAVKTGSEDTSGAPNRKRDADPLENKPPKEIKATTNSTEEDPVTQPNAQDPRSAQRRKQDQGRKRRSPADKSESSGFQTAKAKLLADGATLPPPTLKRASGAPISRSSPPPPLKKQPHAPPPTNSGKFVPPFVKKALQATTGNGGGACQSSGMGASHPHKEGPLSARTLEFLGLNPDNGGELPEDLAKLDAQLIEQICNEVIHGKQDITWDDIAGQETAKRLIQEIVVWPMLNPHIFRGARAPPRGLLLFGPPGTGKTLLGRAIASNIKATFFSISASSLTSKWIGEGEKLVRTLFTVARRVSPAVIFIDEIDSILSARRSDGEHEASRRLKTEMLVQMEGVGVEEEGRQSVLLIGATNRPEELDEAARRRLPKQLYIPLPCPEARRQMVQRQLLHISSNLSTEDLDKIVLRTEGYSGSDMKNLIQEACQGPVRDAVRKSQLAIVTENAREDSLGDARALETSRISQLQETDLRPVNIRDFAIAAKAQRASVEAKEIVRYEEYNAKHGAKFVSPSEEEEVDDW